MLRSTLENLDDNGVGVIKQEVLDSLNARFEDVENSPLLLVATLLDPRYKDKMFSSNDIRERARTEVLKLFRHDIIGESSDPEEEEPNQVDTPQDEKLTIWDKMAKRMKRFRPEAESSGADSEAQVRSMEVTLNLYCAEDVIPLRGDGSDPFQYWQTKKVLWPKLAQMATKYLSVPPGSVYSERLFSSAGNVDSPARTRLSGEHSDQLT